MISLEKLHARLVEMGAIAKDSPVSWDSVMPFVTAEQYNQGIEAMQPMYVGQLPDSIAKREDGSDADLDDNGSVAKPSEPKVEQKVVEPEPVKEPVVEQKAVEPEKVQQSKNVFQNMNTVKK